MIIMMNISCSADASRTAVTGISPTPRSQTPSAPPTRSWTTRIGARWWWGMATGSTTATPGHQKSWRRMTNTSQLDPFLWSNQISYLSLRGGWCYTNTNSTQWGWCVPGCDGELDRSVLDEDRSVSVGETYLLARNLYKTYVDIRILLDKNYHS